MLVRKLHEANSAMNVMEKSVKEFMDAEDNKSKDLIFYKNKNTELMTEIQFLNDKIIKEKDQYEQLKKE